jgi:hypothetical protein
MRYIIRLTSYSGVVMYSQRLTLPPRHGDGNFWGDEESDALHLDKRVADAEYCEIHTWAYGTWTLEVLEVP